MSAKLSHEALAETHNLAVGLALRIKVGTALAAAHRKGGQGVLEDLLEAEELDDTNIYGGVQSDTALVRTDSGVELDTETSVYLYLAVVVNPRNAEDDLSLRLNDSVENACVDEVLSLFSNRLKGLENLSYRLNELRLAGISFLNGLKKICKIFVS